MRRTRIPLAGGLVSALAAAVPVNAYAVNWLMLRGTEPPQVTHRAFGAVSVHYANYLGCERLDALQGPAAANNGYYVNNCRVGPELDNDNDGVNLDALVAGLRGNLVPGRINYFLTVNAGANQATYEPLNTDRARLLSLTDASVTFSYIPGARVRVGLFRKPGPEELMQSLRARDYIFLTDFTRRDQIERFVEGNAKGTNPIPGQGDAGSVSTSFYDADAARDWGIQVFDAFKRDKWTHTYAVMLANGNGIHHSDNNSEKDINLYWSSEYDLPGGKGWKKHGVKLYGYYQHGVRNFIADSTTGALSEDFDRIRYGIGFKALGPIFGAGNGKHRLAGELMYAQGMVLVAATTSCTNCPYGGLIQIAAEDGNKARGITLDYGYYPSEKWRFDIRYSQNDLLYETSGGSTVWKPWDERELRQLDLGVTYTLNPKTDITVNYAFRSSEAPVAAPNPVAANNAEEATSTVGDVFGVRLRHFF